MEDKNCFCKCLFDMSFEQLVTPKILKILYMVGIGIAGIAGVWLVISAFGQSFAMGLLYIIAAPIVFVLLVVVLRVTLELVLTLFRIEENTRGEAAAAVAEESGEEETDEI